MTNEAANPSYRSILEHLVADDQPYKRQLLSYTRRLGLGAEAGEEAIAEAVFRIAKNDELASRINRGLQSGATSIEEACRRLCGYVRRIIQTMSIDSARRERHRTRYAEQMSAERSTQSASRTDETREVLHTALASLAGSERRILWMFYFDRLAMDKIASRMRISPATAYRRKQQAEDHLLAVIQRLMRESS